MCCAPLKPLYWIILVDLLNPDRNTLRFTMDLRILNHPEIHDTLYDHGFDSFRATAQRDLLGALTFKRDSA